MIVEKNKMRSIQETTKKSLHNRLARTILKPLLAAVLLLSFSSSAYAESEAFLDLTSAGILFPESLTAEAFGRVNWLEVDEWGWAMSNNATFADFTGSGGGSKPTVQSLTFTKPQDGSSPLLYQRILTGAPISTVKLDVLSNPFPDGLTFGVESLFTFQNVVFTSSSQAFSVGFGPVEQMTFIFSNFCVRSITKNDLGEQLTNEQLCFDTRTNQVQN